jgi:hypothetical protein
MTVTSKPLLWPQLDQAPPKCDVNMSNEIRT